MRNDIAINILFFEKADQTIECVKSFLPSGSGIYILNNGSSSESAKKLKDFCSAHTQVTIFDSERNLGVSGGRNHLIRNTKESWMFFVDNDITVRTEGWYDAVKDHIRNRPEADVFIPRLYNVHEGTYEKYSPFRIEGRRITHDAAFTGKKMNRFPGGASIVKRSVFEKYGLYEEGMFVGFEDYELALRGIVKDDPIFALLIDDVELVHDHRQALSGEDKRSVTARYDLGKHKESFRYIKMKYGLNVEPSWKYWLENQRRSMLSGERTIGLSIFRRAKLRLERMLQKFS